MWKIQERDNKKQINTDNFSRNKYCKGNQWQYNKLEKG